ncbi:MAG TPA: serine hydrolase domain-containing protein [Tahibacter sp.]|uniref:serine hydrolase domain-containing protein n=1 Tax=Tahibacter sp. TaxID=2056211 RepID=UPI002C788F16|nr:serine hydrolase domain-containing protein [Tahibacter sp.]HSX60737.1 serine hydrolase domain-containing protein [Tahibacter sp.]
MRFSLLYSATAAALALGLSACAPVDTGADQCSDVNINLIEVKDAKYINLPENEGGLAPAKIAQIDALVEDYLTATPVDIAGCAIGITRNDKIALLRGYGLADVDDNRPFTVATPAAIGSISKTLTALAALRLEMDTELTLDSAVYAELGEMPLANGDFTLKQVLIHKAGLSGDPSFNGPFNTLDEINDFYAGSGIEWPSLRPRLVFPGYGNNDANQPTLPNTTALYSNTGYSIAGALIDQRSREADIPLKARGYENYIWNKVARGTSATEPTMISACLNTGFRAGDIKNHATGYDGAGVVANYHSGNGWGWEGPAGGWSMTIGDVARLMLILQSSAVIPKATIDSTMRTYYANSGGLRIGMGLELGSAAQGSWFGKGGNIAGYTSDMKIWPNDVGGSWGVAFLCNQSGTRKGLTNDIHALLTSTTPPIAGGGISPGTGGPLVNDETPPWLDIAKRYETLVRRMAGSYLDGSETPERAWAAARSELLTLGNGRSLVAALDRGDIATAVTILPTLSWPDGSPVTP